MKKMMFACVTLTLAVTVSAVEKLDLKTCTDAEVRAALAEVLSLTDGWWECGVSNGLWSAFGQTRFSHIRLEADEAMAAKGYAPDWWWGFTRTYPKISELAMARNGADKAYAKSIDVAKRLNADIRDPLSFIENGGTLEDVAVYLSEAVAFPPHCYLSMRQIGDAKELSQKVAVKAIKRYIRSQGKSFVTKNGINPCETYMTALTTALNAPRFEGLDAWYKSIGFAGVDLSGLPPEEEITKLKQDVLNGDKDMDERNKVILYVCLGVDGYNAFIKEYNGD